MSYPQVLGLIVTEGSYKVTGSPFSRSNVKEDPAKDGSAVTVVGPEQLSVGAPELLPELPPELLAAAPSTPNTPIFIIPKLAS